MQKSGPFSLSLSVQGGVYYAMSLMNVRPVIVA